MLFMNEAEIDYAAQRVAQVRDAGSREVLLKAVKLLQDLKNLANSVSDGWAYWPKPCNAARQLQDLIQTGFPTSLNNFDPPKVTMAQLKKACGPIKAFITKNAKDNWPKLDFPA